MAISKDWYNTEFEENETESKHRPPSVEYSFYTAVKNRRYGNCHTEL